MVNNFNLKEGIKSIFASGTELQLRLHWILRISSAICFIGHGAWGVLTKSEWLPFYDVFNIPHGLAFFSMPVVGLIDIFLGILLLWRPLPAILLYMGVWAVFTAMLRPLAGLGWSEFLERGGNYGAPLALLFLTSVPAQFREWFVIQKEPAFTKVRKATLTWHLRIYTAMLLIGHGGFGFFHKKEMLIDHFRAIGLQFSTAGSNSFITIFGGLEIALGLLILLKPTRSLALFIVFWKLSTEFLYVLHGPVFWDLFEFLERWGSYGCPLALYFLLANKDVLGKADTSLNIRFNKVLIFMCLFVGILIVVPKDLIFKPQVSSNNRVISAGQFVAKTSAGKKLAPGELVVKDFPIEQLKQGGYVVFLRHTPRNIEADEQAGQQRNVHDRLSVCSEATRLNELGVRYAEIIAVQMKRLNIPLGEIITSTSCRTQQMRRLMFPTENYMTMKEMLYLYAREPGANHSAYNSAIIGVLTRAVSHGQNRIILAHKNVIRHDTIGFMVNLEEGDAAIFKPTGRYGEFNIVGPNTNSSVVEFTSKDGKIMATIQEFMNLEFKVAEIKEAKEHPNADRLLVLKVDLGDEQRQIVAGIRKGYTAEELIGKRVVVVTNLDPAVIRGEESQGMCLAASDEEGIALVSPEREVALGSRVK